MRVLIIENDENLGESLSDALNEKKYQTDIAENLKDGKYYISIRNYDLIISNWNLSDVSGVDIINQIKEKTPKVAVIIISHREEPEVEVSALNGGADDFIRFPCTNEVFVARVEARLRSWGSNLIEIEDLLINPDEEKIVYKGVFSAGLPYPAWKNASI